MEILDGRIWPNSSLAGLEIVDQTSKNLADNQISVKKTWLTHKNTSFPKISPKLKISGSPLENLAKLENFARDRKNGWFYGILRLPVWPYWLAVPKKSSLNQKNQDCDKCQRKPKRLSQIDNLLSENKARFQKATRTLENYMGHARSVDQARRKCMTHKNPTKCQKIWTDSKKSWGVQAGLTQI